MDKCVFCRSYYWSKEMDKEYEQKSGFKYVYKVAMIRHTKRPGERRYKGRLTDYNTRGISYQLKYCPECGEKLR